MRQTFPTSNFTPRTFVAVGQIAEDAKNPSDASYFFRAAVNSFSGSIEVAQAQFDLAWEEHDAKNYAASSKQLTEHLAFYADKNTDNRGRAGYWAARDSEREANYPKRAFFTKQCRRATTPTGMATLPSSDWTF